MGKIMKRIGAAAALGAVTLGMAAAPAEARPYYGHYGYHGYRGGHGGAVLGAGILGLAAGAAIASSAYPHYGYRGAYAYDYPPPPPGYYYGGPRCRTVERWDPYYGGYVPVRRCW